MVFEGFFYWFVVGKMNGVLGILSLYCCCFCMGSYFVVWFEIDYIGLFGMRLILEVVILLRLMVYLYGMLCCLWFVFDRVVV